MPVVSNTSPVLNLAIIKHLSLMHEQFGEVVIPRAVWEELHVEEDLPGTHIIQGALTEGFNFNNQQSEIQERIS